MNNNGFYMNFSGMDELSSNIKNAAERYISGVNEITSLVDNSLASVWVGETYQTFKTKYHSNLARIQELYEIISEFAERTDTISAEGQNVANNIKNIIG